MLADEIPESPFSDLVSLFRVLDPGKSLDEDAAEQPPSSLFGLIKELGAAETSHQQLSVSQLSGLSISCKAEDGSRMPKPWTQSDE